MPTETPLTFYPRYILEILTKHLRFAAMYWRYRRILKRIEGDQRPYADVATAPVRQEELDELDLFKTTPAAKFAVEKLKRKSAARAVAASAIR